MTAPIEECHKGSALPPGTNHVENQDVQSSLEKQVHFGIPMPSRVGTPAPLGLFSFATGIFLIATVNLHARDIATPNLIIGVLIFFGGLGQFLSGILEFVRGNSLEGTLWCSYSAFNFSYSMIYIPGTGIIAAYTDQSTGSISPEFNQALSMYCWAWFIMNMLYTIATMRSNWILFTDLAVLDLAFLLLAAGYMTNSMAVLKAGNAVLLVTAFLSYWLGCAILWGEGKTPIQLPVFAMHQG